MNKKKEEVYKCKECLWEGTEEELEWDEVESCFGDDKVELCPKCGSLNVLLQLK